jgi:tetratricopeptide (TPR) repeat protein
MYLEMHQNQNALEAYEAVLKNNPNRFNSLYGAGKSGDEKKAMHYYKQLLAITDSVNSDRKELVEIRKFLSAH